MSAMQQEEKDKFEHARSNAQGWFESICEMVEALNPPLSEDDRNADQIREEAETTIHESPLSVEVRSDWFSPGCDFKDDSRKPMEYRILLSTGGPALQLVGDLNEYGEPTSANLQMQDWFLPWTDYRPEMQPNYEQAARADGWEPYADKFGVACWKTADATFAGTARQLCEFHSIAIDADDCDPELILLTFARCFYFGEG